MIHDWSASSAAETPADYVLRVQDLETRFFTKRGVVNAVNGVSFDLKRGERMAVVGESGSGKSVMAMSLLRSRLLPGTHRRWQVELNGRSVVGARDEGAEQGPRPEAAMVFQDPMTSLNPVLRDRRPAHAADAAPPGPDRSTDGPRTRRRAAAAGRHLRRGRAA